ncbi:hypothetical protein [Alkalinema sp. FACHB-956]|uniref:hypothetical protein n=1 Tax=Alkalinema sp. FACHB-956 TaxID=2692768 RepID=UPI001683888A|nr:hypothetical protein [Alkalinema sp. FACHB-956]MBD2325445.1 hypothetical protein [Alkalinema sp. FACHB-956]
MTKYGLRGIGLRRISGLRGIGIAIGLLLLPSLGPQGMGITPETSAQAEEVGTCANRCPPKPLQFTPGKRIQVQVWNRTGRPLFIEKVQGARPVVLAGGGRIAFQRGGSTEPNASVVFWEKNETPLKAKLSQPRLDVLRVELTFAAQKPGDKALYIRNDGRIDLL